MAVWYGTKQLPEDIELKFNLRDIVASAETFAKFFCKGGTPSVDVGEENGRRYVRVRCVMPVSPTKFFRTIMSKRRQFNDMVSAWSSAWGDVSFVYRFDVTVDLDDFMADFVGEVSYHV